MLTVFIITSYGCTKSILFNLNFNKAQFCHKSIHQTLRLYKARLQRASNLSMGLTRAGTVRTTGLCTDNAGDEVTDDWSQEDGDVGTIGCETSSLARM